MTSSQIFMMIMRFATAVIVVMMRRTRFAATVMIMSVVRGFMTSAFVVSSVIRSETSAIINLGGNIQSIGVKPDGTKYQFGIQYPFKLQGEVIDAVSVEDSSMVSSGIYERYFKIDDVLYHHILDPATGYPVENNLLSVTILSPLSVDGDGLSTTCRRHT